MSMAGRARTDGYGCDAPGQLAALIGIDEALERIARHAAPIRGADPVCLMQAKGRILAEPVRASGMTPPFDNAAMDGYAVDSAAFTGDGPWTLTVADRLPAGVTPRVAIKGNAAARIFTGAPVPPGADAVIRQEEARATGGNVTFDRRPKSGLNIRSAGTDMQPGQIVVPAGAHLGPREIAACAAAGAGTVPVRRALRVGLLVTGSEVRAAGAGRHGAEIWDVNTPMLRAVLNSPQIQLVHVGQVADSRDALERDLADLSGKADLIVTTGGVSVGEEDHVKPALAAIGAELHFSGVAIKPGKPVSYGCVGNSHWLGLPGNPLSAFVTWQIFGAALVRRLTGQNAPRAIRRQVATAKTIHRKPGRCELRPASVIGFDTHGRDVVGFEDAIHSGCVRRLQEADGLIVLPAECDRLSAGALVEFLPFGEIR